MNKNELVDAVAARIGDKRTATAAVEAVLDTVTRAIVAGERVALSGFGVFERVERGARSARNPATGATVDVAATSVPRFRAGQTLKAVVSGKRELPPVPEAPVVLPAPARAPRTAAPTASAGQPPPSSDATVAPAGAAVDDAPGGTGSSQGEGKSKGKEKGGTGSAKQTSSGKKDGAGKKDAAAKSKKASSGKKDPSGKKARTGK